MEIISITESQKEVLKGYNSFFLYAKGKLRVSKTIEEYFKTEVHFGNSRLAIPVDNSIRELSADKDCHTFKVFLGACELLQ